MSRDVRLYAADIVDAIVAIQGYVSGLDFETFAADRKTLDAVVRNLEVIGEAAGKLDEQARSAMPEIEWRKITALRNILAHEYFGVNKEIVWDVVMNRLSSLSDACRRFLDQEKGI